MTQASLVRVRSAQQRTPLNPAVGTGTPARRQPGRPSVHSWSAHPERSGKTGFQFRSQLIWRLTANCIDFILF